MQARLEILKLFQNSISPKPHQISSLLVKQVSTITHLPLAHDSTFSPESPNRPNRDLNLSDPENGDFVIPSLGNWVENPCHENYKSIAAESGTGGDIDKVRGILKRQFPSENLVVKALGESRINATNDLVSQLLERFSNQWVLSFGVFIWAKNQTGYVHTPRLYDFMVDILGKNKKFGIMWKVVAEMNELNGYVSFATMSIVMRRLARAGLYKDTVDAFRGVEKFGLKKDTVALNTVMHALAKQGGVKDAYSLFLEFKDSITLDSHSFNILIHGYCEARMLDDARKTMEEMEKHGFRPDAFSYTCFIKAYCSQKDFRNVEVILKEMADKGCEPDATAYSIYIRALGKARKINEAVEVYEKTNKNGCKPDSKFYSTFIYALGRSGRLNDAWFVFEDMENQGVGRDLWTYNTMIYSACANGQFKSALKLLEKMEENSCKPDLETYQPLLKMCCKMKDMKVLEFLLSHMSKNNVSIDLSTYALLIRQLCESGKLEHACFFFQDAVLNGMVPMDKTCEILLNELGRNNMAEMKEKIENLMLQTKEQILFSLS
ncbi:unnamed protein product [Dovyalis caffra]|uniref:Pentatricopeptide repeat-containing protein n=1 Tax=Dovyalis caffra TaxID=77055 RepID=A0AAV1R2E7_9ROSI|nr:unnamed protein product [Dovyalis caffra]